MSEVSTDRERDKYTPGVSRARLKTAPDTASATHTSLTSGNTHNGERARAAVITPGHIFYGDGTVRDVRPGLVTDVGAVLAGAERMAPECVIVLDGVSLDALRAGDVPGGWKHHQLDGWTIFRRGTRLVALGVRAAMAGRHLDTLFGAGTEPGAVAILLDRYHRLTGCAWRGTPGLSSLALMRSTWGNPRHQPLWRDTLTGVGHVGPLHWSRPLNEWEATWGHVHTFDANSAYLGSAGSVAVAWSALAHTGARPFDKHRPGYWLVEPARSTLELDAEPGRPPLLLPRGDGPVWMTTPYAELLAELGDSVRVLDSWTGDRGVRVLREWQNRLRDARMAAEATPTGGLRDALIRAVKRTATDAIGKMARVKNDEGSLVRRPDWAHALIDLWRANMYRRIIAVHDTDGVWPCAVKVDAVSYADVCDQLDCQHVLNDGGRHHPGAGNLAKAIRVRPGMGGWKHTGAVTTAQWDFAHQRGGAVIPSSNQAGPKKPTAVIARSGVGHLDNGLGETEGNGPATPERAAKPRSSWMMEVWDA